MKEVKKRQGVIVDIDGTLCDVLSVLHFVKRPKAERDYESFIHGSMSCPAKPLVLEWAAKHYDEGKSLLILTGREERFRELSEHYVAQVLPQPVDAFKMAADYDMRPGPETKRDLYDELVDEGWEIVGAIEDRPDITELWHELGIPEVVQMPGFEDEPLFL